jgi:hypothetical protein
MSARKTNSGQWVVVGMLVMALVLALIGIKFVGKRPIDGGNSAATRATTQR